MTRRLLRAHWTRRFTGDRMSLAGDPVPVRHEKREQAETVQLLTALGADVYVLGTRRPRGRPCPQCGTFVAEHAGTCQTPGIADLVVFLPGPVPRAVLFVEQKRRGGVLSPPQTTFRDVCARSTACYVAGTLDDVLTWLQTRKFLR